MGKLKNITANDFIDHYPNLTPDTNPFKLTEAYGFLVAVELIYGDNEPEWVIKMKEYIIALLVTKVV